jgi:hypothetical protein
MPDQESWWPTGRKDLQNGFRQRSYEAEEIPDGAQADLLLRLLRLYARRGLSSAGVKPVALCDICPHARSCWAGLPRRAFRRPTRGGPQDGGIVLPWVGPEYRPGGVVVVGINPNVAQRDPTSLDLEHGISWEHYVNRTFAQGRLTEDGSRFGGDSTRTAGLVLDSLERRPIRDRSPCELTDVLKQTARLQTVKCVPKTEVSTPTGEMTIRCPSFLLRDELKILRPARIVTFGAVARAGTKRLNGYAPVPTRASRLVRGTLTIDRLAISVYHLDHPRYQKGFSPGFESLRRHLQRQARARSS